MTIKPIEYAERLFKSDLESRWTTFFDNLGVSWEYELASIALPSGVHTPDFLLTNVNHSVVWFEVNPAGTPDDNKFWQELADSTQRQVAVAFGMSQLSNDWDMVSYFPDGWDCSQEFCIRKKCGAIGIQFNGLEGRICRHNPKDFDGSSDKPRVDAAYAAARSARFEHGECGA